jgi:hypothetical protein
MAEIGKLRSKLVRKVLEPADDCGLAVSFLVLSETQI